MKIAPFWLVGLLIICYLVLIGPVDYLLVKHVLGRMEATWITFPAMAVAVTLAAYWAAYWMKGSALLVNQVNLVDVDLTSAQPLVRGTGWTDVFSPQMRDYDVQIDTGRALPQPLAELSQTVSWMGLPGTGFGGMNQQTAEPGLFTRAYRFAPQLDAMLGVPIQVWSTKGFFTRYRARVAPGSSLVDAQLQAGVGDELNGSVVQHLGVELKGAWLAYRRAIYRIGNLPANEPFAIRAVERRQLKAELGGRRGAIQGQQWNVASHDLLAILEQMMFYEAAGGRDLTRLQNQYQQFIDLSSHLELGQAILVGEVTENVAPLMLNQERVTNEGNKALGVYRLLLPVKANAPGSP